jgi:hypothetical protein
MRYAIIVLGLIGGLVAISSAEASPLVSAGGAYRPSHVSPLWAVVYRGGVGVRRGAVAYRGGRAVGYRGGAVVRRGAVGYTTGGAVGYSTGGTVGYGTGGAVGYRGGAVVRRGAVGYRGGAAVRRGGMIRR